MTANNMRIVVAGAGSIGAYTGCCLALAGRDVQLLLRPRLAAELDAFGLTISDYEGRRRTLQASALRLHTDPAVLAEADVILVTVKSAATAEMAPLIARYAKPAAMVLSLQNGIGNADVLRGALPNQPVFAGMVPFNVVQLGCGQFHRASEGEIAIDVAATGLPALLTVEGVVCQAQTDMRAVMWGKLLLNLNNALNALAGIPLLDQLQDRAWRSLLADMMDEALQAMRAAGIEPAKVSKVAPRFIPFILRLPTPIFRRVAAAMLKIDPQARSSMWEDLQLGRPTEVDYLQGAVVALARQHGLPAKLCEQVANAIHQAESTAAGSPQWRPAQLVATLPG